MTDDAARREAREFLDQWGSDSGGVRRAFAELLDYLEHMSDVSLEFVSRRGVTHSLRARRVGPGGPAGLFALVDVVEDASGRFLSVCFYAQGVSDPRELGETVPGGLLGEDGHCFDVDTDEPALLGYLFERLAEAFARAGA